MIDDGLSDIDWFRSSFHIQVHDKGTENASKGIEIEKASINH